MLLLQVNFPLATSRLSSTSECENADRIGPPERRSQPAWLGKRKRPRFWLGMASGHRTGGLGLRAPRARDVIAAVLSQFSAAVADTVAAGGDVAESTQGRVDQQQYVYICGSRWCSRSPRP